MNRENSAFNIFKEIIRKFILLIVYLLNELWKEIKKQYTKFIEKQRFSLSFKITLVYVRKTFTILFSFGFLITAGFIVYLGWNAQRTLERDYNNTADYLTEGTELPKDKIKRLAEFDSITITLFDMDKNVLYSTDKEEAAFLAGDSNRDKIKINDRFILFKSSKPIYYKWDFNAESREYNFGFLMALNEKYNWGSRNVYIQIQTKMIREVISVIILFWALLFIDIMYLMSIITSGARASRKILKPVEVMTKTVEIITINELDTRLDVSGSQDELKDLARTFNSMLDRIQQSYEQQNQFVSDASHELRTPISVIQGYANLLDRWGKNDEQVLLESITAIKTESENMKDLVEKLLFLARGDKNTQKVEKESFVLKDLIDEVVRETKLIDNIHDIKCEKNEGITINADRGLMKEAIRILVDNSIKFTPEGGTIGISSFMQNKDAVIIVEDTGVGISKEDLPHIFDRFYRADKSRTRKTGGTGLGLAIARWIILKHNGKIDVTSKINEGTRFRITIPC